MATKTATRIVTVERGTGPHADDYQVVRYTRRFSERGIEDQGHVEAQWFPTVAAALAYCGRRYDFIINWAEIGDEWEGEVVGDDALPTEEAGTSGLAIINS